MAQKTSTKAERVGLSASWGGVAVWIGEEIRLQLDRGQAQQLHRLLVDHLDGHEAIR